MKWFCKLNSHDMRPTNRTSPLNNFKPLENKAPVDVKEFTRIIIGVVEKLNRFVFTAVDRGK